MCLFRWWRDKRYKVNWSDIMIKKRYKQAKTKKTPKNNNIRHDNLPFKQQCLPFSGLEQDYEQARPNYPEAALDYLLNLCPKPSPPVILDVGCGTGKLTRQLAQRYASARIIGCDANADMLAHARASTPNGKISYFISAAEDLPMPDDTVGLLSAAQAVQWFARPAFFAESRRVLAANGILALLENNRNWQSSAFLEAYETLLEDNTPGYSRFYRDHDYAVELQTSGFSDVNAHSITWVRSMSPELFMQMARSSTRIQSAIRTQGETVIADIQYLLNSHITANGYVEIPYITQILTAIV